MANPPSGPTFDWKMYRYTPSLAAAALFLSLFSIMTLLHVYSLIKHRKTNTIYVILGGLCEIAGFAGRIGSHYNNENWAPFLIQGILLLIGPLFFAARVYMMLGRTIRLAGSKAVSRVQPTWYTRVFVTTDITTLIIQGLGASIMGTMQLALALAGEKIVIAGLALQVATFIVFLAATLDVQLATSRAATTQHDAADLKWKKMLRIVYTLSALILFRCVFRLIEYSLGNAAYPIAHEWNVYVFDGVPMLTVLVLLFVFQHTISEEPDQAKDMKVEESGDEEKGMAGK